MGSTQPRRGAEASLPMMGDIASGLLTESSPPDNNNYEPNQSAGLAHHSPSSVWKTKFPFTGGSHPKIVPNLPTTSLYAKSLLDHFCQARHYACHGVPHMGVELGDVLGGFWHYSSFGSMVDMCGNYNQWDTNGPQQ